MGSNILLIAIADGDGNIIETQPYEEFLQGPKSLPIINLYTGQKLFDILVDDVGVIRYEDNKFALKTVLDAIHPMKTVMKLLGKVSEAVIVRRCHEDMEVNQKWLSLARRKKTQIKTAEKFVAYGTGLLSTKTMAPQIFSVSDPQRDILWLSNDGQVALMSKSSAVAGIMAGLQIKVSRDGSSYFLNDLINVKYEVPVVYFDICNDFDSIAQKIYTKNKGLVIGEDFIKASAVDYDAYMEVMFYVDLIEALIYGKITPEQLINHDITKDSISLKNAILSTTLSEILIPNMVG